MQRARAEAQRRRRRSARCRPSACARCCSRSRATCAWCCCGWPRACRRCAASPRARQPCPRELAAESMQVFAPLANRLGIWQIKWELEDLAFRFLEPGELPTRSRAQLDERRAEREAARRGLRASLARRPRRAWHRGRGAGPAQAPLQHLEEDAEASGVDFDACLDMRALRVIVADVRRLLRRARPRARALARRSPASSTTTSRGPRPTATSRCTRWCRATTAAPVEIQIRTARRCTSMPSTASPAHWAYKEAGARGYARRQRRRRLRGAASPQARMAVLRQLLAWERDSPATTTRRQRDAPTAPAFDDRIYVFTPQAAVVELPARRDADRLRLRGAHRPRPPLPRRQGRRRDGAAEHAAARAGRRSRSSPPRSGGPSLDWLNPELGYLQSPRSKAKVRAWFNALRARQRPSRAAARRSRSCCSAKAGRRSSSTTWRRSSAFAAPTRCSRSSARTSSRCATSRRCCGRAEPQRRRRRGIALQAVARDASAGGGVLVVGVESLLTSAGALLPAGAARRDRRLRHARQGRRGPPRRLQQPARARRAARPSA